MLYNDATVTSFSGPRPVGVTTVRRNDYDENSNSNNNNNNNNRLRVIYDAVGTEGAGIVLRSQ